MQEVRDKLQELQRGFEGGDFAQKPSERGRVFENKVVRKALHSFPALSASGPFGITATLLKEAEVGSEAESFIEHLAKIVGVVSNADIPEDVRPYFSGGDFTALDKGKGAVRPIVCGNTIRRLV